MSSPNVWASGSTALFTDRYELTMLEAALRSGRASSPATFEVFTRGSRTAGPGVFSPVWAGWCAPLRNSGSASPSWPGWSRTRW